MNVSSGNLLLNSKKICLGVLHAVSKIILFSSILLGELVFHFVPQFSMHHSYPP